jgi:hypothetical protein
MATHIDRMVMRDQARWRLEVNEAKRRTVDAEALRVRGLRIIDGMLARDVAAMHSMRERCGGGGGNCAATRTTRTTHRMPVVVRAPTTDELAMLYAWMSMEEEEEEGVEGKEGSAVAVEGGGAVPWFAMASERFQERFEQDGGSLLICAFTPAAVTPVAFAVGKKDDPHAIDAIGVRRGWRRLGVAQTVAEVCMAKSFKVAAAAAEESKRGSKQREEEARARLRAIAAAREKRLEAQAKEVAGEGAFWSKATARRLLAALDSDSDSSDDDKLTRSDGRCGSCCGSDCGDDKEGEDNGSHSSVVYRVDALPGSVRFWRALGFEFADTEGSDGSDGGGSDGEDRPMSRRLSAECVAVVDRLRQEGTLLSSAWSDLT